MTETCVVKDNRGGISQWKVEAWVFATLESLLNKSNYNDQRTLCLQRDVRSHLRAKFTSSRLRRTPLRSPQEWANARGCTMHLARIGRNAVNCITAQHAFISIAKRIDVTLALPQTIHQRDPTVHFEAGSFVCRTTGSTNWAILQPAGGGFPPPPPPPFPSVMLRTSTTYAILDAIICTITPVRRISFARVKSKFRISMQKWNKFFFWDKIVILSYCKTSVWFLGEKLERVS